MNTKVEALPSEGYLTEEETKDGSKEIEEQISDFLIKIEGEVYLLECQSYEDGSMAIRIAEYAFLAARQSATWDIGHAVIPLPHFSVIYIKKTAKTPKTTKITFCFPDGRRMDYQSDNIILESFTKEEMIEKRLFPYIPFYLARYESELVSENGNIEKTIEDLSYFRDEMLCLNQNGELSDGEMVDLMGLVNTIIVHITNGNQKEERLVKVMGGTVLETQSEKWIRQGREQGLSQGLSQGIFLGEVKMLIELGQEYGLEEKAILERLQKKIGISLEQATKYLQEYGKQPSES